MADLQELYQSIILDHNRRPKNYGALEGANHRAEGRNPDCGDEVTVELVMTGDRIDDVRFTSAGCAVSRAAASIMTQSVKGKSRAEVEQIFARFHDLVTGKLRPSEQEARGLGELAAFSGVARFPIRVKCASMPWHTLQAALRAAPRTSADPSTALGMTASADPSTALGMTASADRSTSLGTTTEGRPIDIARDDDA